MKKMLALEIRKAFYNKFFWLALGIGCSITLLSLSYHLDLYKTSLAQEREFASLSGLMYNPNVSSNTVFNHWIGGESQSLGSGIFFFVFPLLIAIPCGWSYCEEKTKGYSKNLIIHAGKGPYFFSKYVAVFLSGGCAMVFPLLFNFLLVMLFIPSVTPMVINDVYYGVFGGSLMSEFYYTKPFLYIFFYLCLDFVYAGLLACISLTATAFLKQKWLVIIMPFFTCLLVHYGGDLFYSDPTIIYKQISPLYFLRCINSGLSASWWIIIPSAFILFAVTFIMQMLGEGQREIY